MKASIARNYVALLASCPLLLAGPANAVDPVYIQPPSPPSNSATWPAVNGTYTQNFGIAFTSGPSGPYGIGGINLGLNTGATTSGSASLTLAIRNTTNSIAYSAVAGTTEYAKDTVSFSMPTSTGTNFTLNLTASSLPNITAFILQPNTSYSLIAYAPSASIGLQRRTGYANGTTNNSYAVTNGFTMLDTFRNNTANYTVGPTSYPALQMSLLGTSSSAPVPGPLPILGTLAGFRASRLLRKRIKARR